MDSGTSKVARDVARLRSFQHEATARVVALERTVGEQGEALDSLGGRGSAPEFVDTSAYAALARYVDWVPPAFGVWFLSGGDGKVGVHVPERCVTYNGEAVEDDKWIPDLKKGGPENRVRYCELDCGKDKEILFFVLYCIAGEGSPASKRPWRASLLWAAKADDVSGFFTDEVKVLKIIPVASYDAGKERLVQLHVGVLSFDGESKPLLYEVRWDDSLNSGSGGWKIYLPAAIHPLSFWGEDVESGSFAGATRIPGTDWRTLDGVSTASGAAESEVWLYIELSYSMGEFSIASVGFSSTKKTAAAGNTALNFRVAVLVASTHRTTQLIVGALHVGQRIVKGADTNLVFSPTANGDGIKMDVYYA